MAPTFTEIKTDAIDPLQPAPDHAGRRRSSAARSRCASSCSSQTRTKDLALFVEARASSSGPRRARTSRPTSLIPAFIISELKTAFQIGFLIFLPFLVIDLVVSSTLMSMGMMMLPPVFISLPFKILLFVLVDGWNLVTQSLVESLPLMEPGRRHHPRRRRRWRSRSRSRCRCCGVGLVVGLLVSVFQAVTQIQEQTLSLHPEDPRARRPCSSSAARGCSASSLTYTRGPVARRSRSWWADDERAAARPVRPSSWSRLHPRAGARVAAVPARAAVLSSKMVPLRVRAIVAVGAGGRPVAGRRARPAHRRSTRSTSAALIVKELLVGLGVRLRAGRAVRRRHGRRARCSTRSIGFSFGRLVDPVTGNQSAVLAQLYSLVGVADLHRDRRRRLGDRGPGPHLRGRPAARAARRSARSSRAPSAAFVGIFAAALAGRRAGAAAR